MLIQLPQIPMHEGYGRRSVADGEAAAFGDAGANFARWHDARHRRFEIAGSTIERPERVLLSR